MEMIQQGLALAAVFGLLGFALWLVRTRQNPAALLFGTRRFQPAERRIQVLERVALTQNHTLCLVRVGDRNVLIGTGPTSCQLMETDEDIRA
jgi:flagellar biogenesis protein FliO